jgi:hypothetical protein
MIARLTAYRTTLDAVEGLIDEIVALARASGPARRTNRRGEFFFLDRPSGNGLSVLIGDDDTVTPVIELNRAPSDKPEEYEVQLWQVGGPTGSGVVEALFGRVVRCDAAAVAELNFNGDSVPTSPDVWTRALLLSSHRKLVVALAVASDRPALEESLRKFSARCTTIDDYDEVAYHFFRHAED